MATLLHRRSRSDPPPPITVEDTATGADPVPTPSPSMRSFSATMPIPSNPNPTRKSSAWETHTRKSSPGIEWHEKWTDDSWKQGRVLLTDYVAKDHTSQGRRKIVAQEFQNIDQLRKFYKNRDLSQQAALRVIHVQNASWATRYLLRKFNIDANDDLVGSTFGRWAKYQKPQRRGNKPVLNGKTFPMQRDPWRGISRTSFGMDYLRHYDKNKTTDAGGMKFHELNSYDKDDQPAYAYDVYVQRLSVYVQLSDGQPGLPLDEDLLNPYNEEERQEYQRLRRQYGSIDVNGHEQYTPKLQTLDNGSTIIVFEYSQSGSVKDTLIGARQEIESRWRRLTFYLSKEDLVNDERLALQCMDLVLKDILKALSFAWEKYLGICEIHVGILEDKIYENPADESRAPELWTNSSLWLKVERLMYIHTDIVKEMRHRLKELALDDPHENEPWLGSSADELDKLITQFQEGVVKPTTNLSDLMYKSVGIRDARHSLQLGLSMWRLSWITFIFLPLTFVCGFFGMNVEIFESNPSLKWWFITTIPLFVVVTVLWYGVKHTLSAQRQHPLRRGVYEALYYDLSKDYPHLWTRRGPRTGVAPLGWWSAVKWRLLNSWFNGEGTLVAKSYDPGDEELGVWNRVKRKLVRRWLSNMRVVHKTPEQEEKEKLALENAAVFEAATKDLGAVGELLSLATPIALADADPMAATRFRQRLPLGRFRSLSPTWSEGRPGSEDGGGGGGGGGTGGRRSQGDVSEGIMVEEKGGSEDERSGSERGSGDDAERGRMDGTRDKRERFRERLNVPVYSGQVGGGGMS
ncbi:hypothetical protein K504DRAFT_465173 [Pleomassaria siparia CBS 279.74]|uniref:Cora-domain-containing protein n=1 Tax=Pleomassaria siparia CBS 279.74 TaxID=1314801 RepID=A0A6G1KEU3_9PLEO|nr:hypothetical protein K504DRAFT_465173 [Pleomassaria siparia CBS 279.74]